jgi:APA family basic amino acid/polyamine antiporter
MNRAEQNHVTLKQSVTTLETMAIVVGMIIGSGIFLKPGIVLKDAGSEGMSLLAWVAGGLITLASALSIAEIAAEIPKSGGLYTYMAEIYGDRMAFLLGWVQAVISYPASVAAQAIAFATYCAYFLPMNGLQQKFLGVGALVFVLIMNILSTKCGGVIQVLATIGKLIPVAAIILFGLIAAPSASASPVQQAAVQGSGFGIAILGTLWAYDGWIGVTNMAGEVKNPAKVLPKVICGGVIFVIAVYAAFNFAIFRVLPQSTIISTETPGADAAQALFGKSGAAFLTAGIIISTFGALNGYLMTAARVPQVMGEKNRLPFAQVLGKVNPRFRTPANSLIFESVLAVIYIFSGSFNTLTDMLIFVLWIFFTMGVFGVFLLRRRSPEKRRAYSVPLYPVTPVVGIAGGAYILISTIIGDPIRSLIGIGITLVGLPIYSYMIRKKKTEP